jgi:hypothetical protein
MMIGYRRTRDRYVASFPGGGKESLFFAATVPAMCQWQGGKIASWVRYCRPAMLMVLSQPLFRQRHAVHVVTPRAGNPRRKASGLLYK